MVVVVKSRFGAITEPPTALRDKDIIELRVEGTGFAAKTETSRAMIANSYSSM